MELIFVVAKLISGTLYEVFRLIFLVIDKLCNAIANVIKSPEKREADMNAAMEARHKSAPEKAVEMSFDDMFPEEKDDDASKRNEIDIDL